MEMQGMIRILIKLYLIEKGTSARAASAVGAWVCHGKVCNQRKIPALLRVRIYHWLMCVVFFK